jgi:hypothetical protein
MYFPLNKKQLLFGNIQIRLFSHLLYKNNKSFYMVLVEIKNNERYEYIIHKINYYPKPVSGKYIYDILNTEIKLLSNIKTILKQTNSVADICVFLDLFMNDKTIKDEQNVLQLYQTSLVDDENIHSSSPPICNIYTQDKLSSAIAFLLKYINHNEINKKSSVLYYVEKNADELKQFLGIMPNNVIYSNMYNSNYNTDVIIKLIKHSKKYLKNKDTIFSQVKGENKLVEFAHDINDDLLRSPSHSHSPISEEKEDETEIDTDIINTETIELLMETCVIKINNEDKILSYYHILSNNFLNILYLSSATIHINDFNDFSFKDNKIKEHIHFIKERSPDYFNASITTQTPKSKNILIKEWYLNELNKKYKAVSATKKNKSNNLKIAKSKTRRTASK